MKTALICGVSGQDGAYLAKLLLEKGYHVFGTSRDAQVANFGNLDRLSITDHIERESMVLTDFRSTLQTISKAKPDEVYNRAGQSSVALSFQQPVETMDSISVGTLNLLEAVRFLGSEIRDYNASSSESFGDTQAEAASEQTPFHPRSTRSLKRPHIGRLSTIAMHTACLPPMGSCSTTNLRSGRSALSRKRLFAPPAAFEGAGQRLLSSVTSRSNEIGDGRRNMSRRFGASCSSRRQTTSWSQPDRLIVSQISRPRRLASWVLIGMITWSSTTNCNGHRTSCAARAMHAKRMLSWDGNRATPCPMWCG